MGLTRSLSIVALSSIKPVQLNGNSETQFLMSAQQYKEELMGEYS